MSQAMPISELFSTVLNYFPSGLEHFKKYVGTALKLLFPYIVACICLTALTTLTGMITGVGIAAHPSLSDGSSASALENTSLPIILVAIVAGLLLFVLSLLIIPFAIYYSFCKLRFIVNSHKQTVETLASTNLWAFDDSFWGYLGLACLLFLIAIPSIIAIAIGFLLVLPGWAMLGLFSAYCNSTIFSYFEDPTSGVSTALGKGLEVVKAGWKQWLILSLILGLFVIAFYIIYIPIAITVVMVDVLPIMAFLFKVIMYTIYPFLGFYSLCIYYRCYRDLLPSIPNQQLG